MKENKELTNLNLPMLTTVTEIIWVRTRPRLRSANRARSREHSAKPPLLLSRRVATRAPGDWERKARNSSYQIA